MYSFHDIQRSKQDLKKLVLQRQNLITDFYHEFYKELEGSNESNKKIVSLEDFQEHFKIKNIAQIPNFREFRPNYLKRTLGHDDHIEGSPNKKLKPAGSNQTLGTEEESFVSTKTLESGFNQDDQEVIKIANEISSSGVTLGSNSLKDDLNKYFSHGGDIQKANINAKYKPDYLNTSESVILLMDNRIPSKITASRPLLELRYLANTLPLHKLLPGAHKALTTDNWNTGLQENRLTVVGSRIEELKRNGMWPSRQPRRFVDPIKQLFNKQGQTMFKPMHTKTTHQYLMEEAKWMYTDFREYKKFKLSQCAFISQAIMDYWSYGKDACCIKIKSPVTDENGDAELETEVESIPRSSINHLVPMFKYQLYKDDTELSKIEKAVVDSLPLYKPFGNEEPINESQLDFVSASKLAYPADEDNFNKLVEKDIIDTDMSLTSLSKKRGLFGGTNRRAHYVKPPQPPPLELLEYRTPTLWLPSDDEKLVSFINLYRFNWDIVSAHMTTNTTDGYVSTMDRRSPWNCFERYVQLNEKFDINDLKGYRANIAHHWMVQAHKVQNKLRRRISPLGITEESVQRGHRRLRWASLFEAMRRVMRKREHLLKLQSQQPPRRTPMENTGQPVATPQQMASLKAQRDEALRKELIAKRMNKQMVERQQQQNQQKNLGQTPQSKSATPATNGSGTSEQANISTQNSPQVQNLDSQQKQASNSGQSQNSKHPTQRAGTSITPSSDLILKNKKNIIESYAKKYLAQKPDVTPEDALQAAENYFRIVLKQQQQREAALLQYERNQSNEKVKSDQQQIHSQPTTGNNNVPSSENQDQPQTPQKVKQSSSTKPITQVHTPTPQELLQRIQEQRQDEKNNN